MAVKRVFVLGVRFGIFRTPNPMVIVHNRREVYVHHQKYIQGRFVSLSLIMNGSRSIHLKALINIFNNKK